MITFDDAPERQDSVGIRYLKEKRARRGDSKTAAVVTRMVRDERGSIVLDERWGET